MPTKVPVLKYLLAAVMLLPVAAYSEETKPASSLSRMCVDMLLTHDLVRADRTAPKPRRGRMRAILAERKLWVNGSTLQVMFSGGNSNQHAIVQKFAKEWAKYANINFEFIGTRDAKIRVSFIPGVSWSYVGTDSQAVSKEKATMNFGWVDKAIVLHLFGHALGLNHEHEPPKGGLQWNRETVIRAISGSPTFWTAAQIEHHIFKKYSGSQIRGNEFDRNSIMRYQIPEAWTIDGYHTEFSETLSKNDKAYIGSEEAYPR